MLVVLMNGLGWFDLALGTVEVPAPGKLDRALGLGCRETLTPHC